MNTSLQDKSTEDESLVIATSDQKEEPANENIFFNGSYGGDNQKITARSRLECKICWYEYNPEQGDTYWQIPAGTPFSQLPDHWVCPECGGKKNDFLVIDT